MPESPHSSSPKESAETEMQNPNPCSDSEVPLENKQTLTLENRISPAPELVDHQVMLDDQQGEELQVVVDEQEQDDPEPEGMSISLSTPPHHPSMSDTLDSKSNPPVSSVRRAPKRKKGFGKNHKSQVALEKKLQALSQNFKPIPFVPGKALDFSRHEELLKRLGLWEFAHIEFDRNLRVDVILKLIANYSPKQRGSYVNDCKIGVNRADLGRALKLPGKKSADNCDLETFSAESLSFLDEFVSNWILLHDEDLWCTPTEVLNWTNLIKSGHPEKIDWAGLVWYMVEKELAQAPNLRNCYYASHLQQLVKVQKEELLREIPKVELGVEEDEDGGDMKVLDFNESSLVAPKSEEQDIELKLGQDCVTQVENLGDADHEEKDGDADQVTRVEEVDEVENVDGFHNIRSVEDVHEAGNIESREHVDNVDNTENIEKEIKDVDMMDFEDCKGEEQGQWLLDGNNDGGQHFLQRCNLSDVKVFNEDTKPDGVDEDIEDEEVEEDGQVEGFKIMQKGPLNGMSSANAMQGFETEQLPYTSIELGGQSSLGLMSSRAENNLMLGSPSMFNHAGKREIGHEHDISHHDLNDNHKRMRIDGSWDQRTPNFDVCIEQIVQWVEKAKVGHEAAKEEAYQQANMTQQIYAHEMADKDSEIMQLRCRLDELQRKRQTDISRLDKELYLMSSVIDGYRRALKETQKAFSEYRKRFPVPDEPIYKDAGSGGVVKSIAELEKERLKQEEEKKMMCYLLEETYKKHVNDYETKWEVFLTNVESLDSRLLNAAAEVELLKEHLVKRKTSGNDQNESSSP